MLCLDATCPLASKDHVEAERHFDAGREIILIGPAGLPEVIGTMGQCPAGAKARCHTVEDAMRFGPHDPQKLAVATQTTLSVDASAAIVSVLQGRFPAMAGPHKEVICYATTNRQDAVKRLAQGADLLLVIGSQNSSNSVRLVEVGLRAGAKAAQLIDDAGSLDWLWLNGVSTIGITAGASAPERLVEGLIEALNQRFEVTVEEINPVRETVTFKLPRLLAEGTDASGA